MYTFLGNFRDLGDWLTPYGKQVWVLCRTRKPFICAKSGKEWPAGTFAWRPLHSVNRGERIAVDHSLDTRSVAEIVVGHPEQARLVRGLAEAEKPMPLHLLSHRARLNHRRSLRAFESLNRQGLLRVVDEWGETPDWFQPDGARHESCVIGFT